MGLFFPEDPHFDENQRQTGFYRYRQLLSTRFGRWWKINLLTLTGFAPLAAGIFYAVASSSLLALLPCSILGGVIAGPFLAGMMKLRFNQISINQATKARLLVTISFIIVLASCIAYSLSHNNTGIASAADVYEIGRAHV